MSMRWQRRGATSHKGQSTWWSRYTLTTRHLSFKGEELKLEVHWNRLSYLRATCSSFLYSLPSVPFPHHCPLLLPSFPFLLLPHLCFTPSFPVSTPHPLFPFSSLSPSLFSPILSAHLLISLPSVPDRPCGSSVTVHWQSGSRDTGCLTPATEGLSDRRGWWHLERTLTWARETW